MTYLQGKEQSDLFKTHTIWVARLLAQDGTRVCVSEVTRSEEMERRGEKEFVSNVYICAHMHLSARWFLPAVIWDSSDNYAVKKI